MEFKFTEEHVMLREMVKKFVDKELRPIAEKIDKEKQIPKEFIKRMGELGLLGVPFPEEYGGAGMGKIGYCIVSEEISRGCGSTATFLGAHTSIGTTPIYLDGTEEQKKKYLVPLAKGEMIGAFALTEPNAGSDAAAIEMSARRDGDYFILNGTKQYITNGNIADIVITIAVTDKALGPKGGVTAFIVETKTPGFSVGKIDEKMGIRGSGTAELIYQDVKVHKDNVLGKVGYGFLTAMKTLDVGRLGLGAGCLGGAKEILDISTKHANTRVQFGGPLSEKQAIQWMLAEMATLIYATESMVYRAAWMADQGMRFSREAAICKLFSSEMLGKVADMGVQIHGGLGYMEEYPMARYYRDARIHRIFEGTNEIQKLIIAREIIKKGGY